MWWEYLLLAFVGAAAVLVARQTRHPLRCPACRAARKAVRRWHPDWRVFDVWHRASEAARDVVAVFYMPPLVLIKPAPYILVAVSYDGGAEELPSGIESPYAIRGRK